MGIKSEVPPESLPDTLNSKFLVPNSDLTAMAANMQAVGSKLALSPSADPIVEELREYLIATTPMTNTSFKLFEKLIFFCCCVLHLQAGNF